MADTSKPTTSKNVVSGFLTDLRSQYVATAPDGGTTTNWNNITKDTFNSGVVGAGHLGESVGEAIQFIARQKATHLRAAKKINIGL